MFPGRNKAIGTETKPVLVPRDGGGKKKELDSIAMETLRRVIDSSDNKLELERLDLFQKKQFEKQIHDTLSLLLEEVSRHLSQNDKQRVTQYVSDEIFGYGPITTLLQDPGVTEIMVNGYDNVYAERDGKITKTEITFRDNNHVLHTINKIITPLGRRIDESSPTVDARLPDGSRVNAIIPPLSLCGPSLTIRKFAAKPLTAADLISHGTLTEEMALFLAACVRSRVNIVVSGGTGSGKTTTLNLLSNFIPANERIVTIEDTAELQLQQDHLVTLESRPANIEGKGQFTIRELVVNSLRMRPDRIIIGEVRGGEALDMLQAMNTGHDGSISTLHANSPRDALARLETMVLMAGMELPLRAIREQVGSAIELIVQQDRFGDGSRKITRISAVAGLQKENLVVKDIFVFQQSSIDEDGRVHGEHLATGYVPPCLEKLKANGESIVGGDRSAWNKNGEIIPSGNRRENLLDDEEPKNLEEAQGKKRYLEERRGEPEVFEGAKVLPLEPKTFKEHRGYSVITGYQMQKNRVGKGGEKEENKLGIQQSACNPMFEAAADPFQGAAIPMKELSGKTEHLADPMNSRHAVVREKESVPYWEEERSHEAIFKEGKEEEPPFPEIKPTWPSVRIKENGSADSEGQSVRIAGEVRGCSAVAGEKTIPAESRAEGKDAWSCTAAETAENTPGKGIRQHGLAASIPPGRRAIALTVNENSGLYSYLKPGDKVDVLVIYHDQGVHEHLVARTAAQSAVVLDIRANGGKNSKCEETDAAPFSVILAVTPAQSETLAYAGFKGSFCLALCPDTFLSPVD